MLTVSIEAVEKEFREKGADIEIFPLDDSGATVEEAAVTIGVEADAIAKTLALHLGNDIIIVVMSGGARLDNKRYRASFGAKAKCCRSKRWNP
jgi:prolyl-tRNA editing enzyme YbaK/EbsC (Cys-tRNA(Pro) deacylase)